MAKKKTTATDAVNQTFDDINKIVDATLDGGEIIENDENTEEVESNEVESNEVESNEVESNEVESNEIESNEIESNEIESNEVESNEVESTIEQSETEEEINIESSEEADSTVEQSNVEEESNQNETDENDIQSKDENSETSGQTNSELETESVDSSDLENDTDSKGENLEITNFIEFIENLGYKLINDVYTLLRENKLHVIDVTDFPNIELHLSAAQNKEGQTVIVKTTYNEWVEAQANKSDLLKQLFIDLANSLKENDSSKDVEEKEILTDDDFIARAKAIAKTQNNWSYIVAGRHLKGTLTIEKIKSFYVEFVSYGVTSKADGEFIELCKSYFEQTNK